MSEENGTEEIVSADKFKPEEESKLESPTEIDILVTDRINTLSRLSQMEQAISERQQRVAQINMELEQISIDRNESIGMLKYINTRLRNLGIDVVALDAGIMPVQEPPEEEGENTGTED